MPTVPNQDSAQGDESVAGYARSVDEALARADTHPETAARDAMRSLGDRQRPLLWPLSYTYVEPDSDRDERPFAPMVEWVDGSSYPPPLGEVEVDIVEQWAQIAAELAEPVGRARYEDVLWVRRHGSRPDLHAQAAVEAYAEAAEQDRWNSIARADFLARGLEIAVALSRHDLIIDMHSRLIASARSSLTSSDPAPGVTMRLLAPLVRVRAVAPPTDLPDLLAKAFEVYSHPWVRVEVLELMSDLDEEEGQRDRRAQMVEVWRQAADGADGLARLSHLRQALEIATRFGLADLAREVRREIERIPPESMEMKSVSASVDVDRQAIEDLISQICEADDWSGVLRNLAGLPALAGDPAVMLQQARDRYTEFPLQNLMDPLVLGAYGEVVIHLQSEDDKLDWSRTQAESTALQFAGMVIAESINSAMQKLGPPDPGETARAFEADWIPETRAARMAAALLHFCQRGVGRVSARDPPADRSRFAGPRPACRTFGY